MAKHRYVVVEEISPCTKCDHGGLWNISDTFTRETLPMPRLLDPQDGDDAEPFGFEDEEFAHDICELLNQAFEKGVQRGRESKGGMTDKEAIKACLAFLKEHWYTAQLDHLIEPEEQPWFRHFKGVSDAQNRPSSQAGS